MVMLGGAGTITGPMAGAFLYEEMRGVLLTSASISHLQLVIAGFLLLMIVLFAPGGLVGLIQTLWPRLRKVVEELVYVVVLLIIAAMVLTPDWLVDGIKNLFGRILS